jgi:hypothetical protein
MKTKKMKGGFVGVILGGLLNAGIQVYQYKSEAYFAVNTIMEMYSEGGVQNYFEDQNFVEIMSILMSDLNDVNNDFNSSVINTSLLLLDLLFYYDVNDPTKNRTFINTVIDMTILMLKSVSQHRVDGPECIVKEDGKDVRHRSVHPECMMKDIYPFIRDSFKKAYLGTYDNKMKTSANYRHFMNRVYVNFLPEEPPSYMSASLSILLKYTTGGTITKVLDALSAIKSLINKMNHDKLYKFFHDIIQSIEVNKPSYAIIDIDSLLFFIMSKTLETETSSTKCLQLMEKHQLLKTDMDAFIKHLIVVMKNLRFREYSIKWDILVPYLYPTIFNRTFQGYTRSMYDWATSFFKKKESGVDEAQRALSESDKTKLKTHQDMAESNKTKIIDLYATAFENMSLNQGKLVVRQDQTAEIQKECTAIANVTEEQLKPIKQIKDLLDSSDNLTDFQTKNKVVFKEVDPKFLEEFSDSLIPEPVKVDVPPEPVKETKKGWWGGTRRQLKRRNSKRRK